MEKSTEVSQNNISYRLELLIKQLEIKPVEFAKRAGLQRKSISNYLLNRSVPNLEALEKIFTAFVKLNARWLILGIGEMWESEPAPIESTTYKNKEGLEDIAASESVMIQHSVNAVVELAKQVEAYEVINDKLRNEIKKLKDELKNK